MCRNGLTIWCSFKLVVFRLFFCMCVFAQPNKGHSSQHPESFNCLTELHVILGKNQIHLLCRLKGAHEPEENDASPHGEAIGIGLVARQGDLKFSSQVTPTVENGMFAC